MAVDLAVRQAHIAEESQSGNVSPAPALATDAALARCDEEVDALLFAPDSLAKADDANHECDDASDDGGISDELLAAIGV